MAAQPTDLITQATTSSRPTATQVTTIRVGGGTTLQCNVLTGWPTATAVHFITYKIDTSGNKIAGSQIDMKGIVSGTQITQITIRAGSDVGNAVGDIVEASPTAAWANDLQAWGTAQHDELGAHTAVTAISVAATGVINTSTVSSLQDTGIPLSTYRTDSTFDYVVSGGVWTADSVGVSLNASMTAIVVWINGQRLSIGAVTARAFTTNVDTYIDVLNTAGVGSLVYTTAVTNAASPALAANSIRIGIIQAAATIIATTKVNQGQEDRVFPIASSIPYAVTDSLGNLICPRDPNRKILGYRQLLVNTSGTAAAPGTQANLTCPVIVPTGRKIKISTYGPAVNQTGSNTGGLAIVDGTIGGGGTTLQLATGLGLSTIFQPMFSEIVVSTTGSKTYNIGVYASAGTTTVSGSTTNPIFIKVELI